MKASMWTFVVSLKPFGFSLKLEALKITMPMLPGGGTSALVSAVSAFSR
jgi:hypothetical protein